MASTTDEFRIPKLTAENYYAWSIRARAALVQRRLWDAIDPGFGISMSQEEKDKNERALTFLFLIVEDCYLDDIGEETKAKNAWQILKEIHTSRGLLHKLNMLKEFVQIEKLPSESMKDYISRFTEKQRQMQACGFGFNEKENAGLLLAGLPSRYEMFVTSNFNQDGEDLEMKTVKAKLLMEEKRILHQDNTKEEEKRTMQALKVRQKSESDREEKRKERTRNSTKGVSTFQKKDYIKCYSCNKFGHIAKDCPLYHKFKRDEKLKSDEKDERARITIHQALICTKDSKDKQRMWFLDSGASDHMSSQKDKFIHLENYESVVEIANGESIAVKGIGSMIITVDEEHGGLTFKIERILYVPKLDGNLLSVGKLTEKGLTTNFQEECAIVTNKGNDELIRAKKEKGLYIFFETTHEASIIKRKETQLWHRRLGHLHIDAIKRVEKDKQLNIDISDKDDDDRDESLESCETCIVAKMNKKKFAKGEARRAHQPLELIHSDLVGKIEPTSKGRANYFITFIDDYSRYTSVYFLKTKDEALEAFKQFKARAETQKDAKIKCIRSDNGGEFTSTEFEKYLKQEGIAHQLTVPYTPQQNGVAERMNQTLLNTARCMIIESGVPLNFWAEAINTACYIRNKCPSRSIENKIPEELWTGKEVDVSHLRVFGCKAWAVVDEAKRRGKFAPKAEECVMIGYSSETKGYKLWKLNDRIFMSRNVRFEEDMFPLKTKGERDKTKNEGNELTLQIESESSIELADTVLNEKIDLGEVRNNEEHSDKVNGDARQLSLFEDAADPDYNIDRTELPLPKNPQNERRSERIAAKNNFQMKCALTGTNEMPIDLPTSAEEALSGNEAKDWEKAMKEEIKNLKKCDTWELVKRPKDQKVIGSRWIYRKKYDEKGNLVRYKARLVAQGYSQVQGIDFDETYSPVVKIRSLRFLISLTVEFDWEDVHVDIVSAYVNSELYESVYMEQPEAFTERNKEDWVLKLKRALYGLHQSGREWNRKLDAYLKDIGLIRSASDPCIYFHPEGELIIGVYVDDIAGIGTTDRLNTFVEKLQQKFEIKNLGRITNLLSIKIERPNDGYVTLDQTKFVENILKKFEMNNCRSVATPLDPGTSLSKKETPEEELNHPYRQLIGSLLYLACGTRPDLAFPVTYLSQFNDFATKQHWNAAKHVLRYLNGTKNVKVTYNRTGEKMSIYADADWGGDKLDRKSWTGYIVKFAGGAISWRSKKQKTVALSTVEAEFMAMCEAAKEALWWKHFVDELGLSHVISETVELRVDNQGAIALAKKWETSDRNKHMDIKYYFLRELLENEKIKLTYVPTDKNLADMFTKKISGKRLKYHSENLQIIGN